MDILKGAKEATSNVLTGTGDTLDLAGESLNEAADRISGDAPPPPESGKLSSLPRRSLHRATYLSTQMQMPWP